MIHIDTLDPEKADPNLEKDLDDIRTCRRGNPDFEFSFELITDGCVVEDRLSESLNAFVKDSSSKDSMFYFIWESSDLGKYVRDFLLGMINGINVIEDDDAYLMEVFLPRDGFGFKCQLPKELIPVYKYNEYIGLGPDWLKGSYTLNVILKYIAPAFYKALVIDGLQDETELRDLDTYMIGLA